MGFSLVQGVLHLIGVEIAAMTVVSLRRTVLFLCFAYGIKSLGRAKTAIGMAFGQKLVCGRPVHFCTLGLDVRSESAVFTRPFVPIEAKPFQAGIDFIEGFGLIP